MSNEQMHEKIDNIEKKQWAVSNRLIVTVIIGIVTLTLTAASLWYNSKQTSHDNDNEVSKQFIIIQNEIKYDRLKDSLQRNEDKIQHEGEQKEIKNTIDQANRSTEQHFENLEERIKHLRPITGVIEMRVKPQTLSAVK